MRALSQFGNLLEVERIGRMPARQGVISAPAHPDLTTLRFHVQAESAPDLRGECTLLRLPEPEVNPKSNLPHRSTGEPAAMTQFCRFWITYPVSTNLVSPLT